MLSSKPATGHSDYREGALLPVLVHNLADVHRPWELGELVSSKDISEKKL